MKHSLTDIRYRACYGQHFGAWACEPTWLSEMVATFNSGMLKPVMQADDGDDETEPMYDILPGGIARVSLAGYMTKARNSFGGCSTQECMAAIRTACNDSNVRAVVVHVDSPGGAAAGVRELAQCIQAASAVKPCHAHIAGMGCSGAYYAIAGCDRITADADSIIGSIGTFSRLVDSSEAAKNEGLKVHLITSGPLKGAGAPGTKITDAQIASVQAIIDGLTAQFVEHVNAGRNLSMKAGEKPADGGKWLAAQARELGLIDDVTDFDSCHRMLVAQCDAADAEKAMQSRVAARTRMQTVISGR